MGFSHFYKQMLIPAGRIKQKRHGFHGDHRKFSVESVESVAFLLLYRGNRQIVGFGGAAEGVDRQDLVPVSRFIGQRILK